MESYQGFWGLLLVERCSPMTISCLAFSTLLSALILFNVLANDFSINTSIYVWTLSGGAVFEIGFLIDSLSATMMLVVTFVSLMVHIYTIGYMVNDPGYQRFFSFISLFTFAMLMLVMSNNFLQLFFGWEAVGLISYLLIGFWYKKPSAISANLKAFLVNRVGDLGFILGVGLILATFGTLDFKEVFELAPQNVDESLESLSGFDWSVISVICLLLFVGAMGKSAQVPLHVWLPDSMEGPTPISALIHAATMVTAGIFMVARMSPLFELSSSLIFCNCNWRGNCAVYWFVRVSSKRHQTSCGVLYAFPTWLYDSCIGSICILSCNVSLSYSRFF